MGEFVKGSELMEKQMQFSAMVMLLLQFITMRGWRFTFGDAYRDPRCPYGAKKSLHQSRLAIDINVFRPMGRDVENNYRHVNEYEWFTLTGDYTEIGKFWESIGGTWGGRFGDGNHFSLEHDGMK